MLIVPSLSRAVAPQTDNQFAAMLSMDLEELVDLEVEIATGVSMPAKLAPAVASVITAEQIENMGATTLDEVLETVPGLHVSVSGVTYLKSIWSIRGIHTKINPQVLFLINGVPYNSTYSGGTLLCFTMPTAMISKVEVVRGPGSALHGADAFSGVVNVVTKNGADIDGTRLGSRIGSFDTYDFWAQHGGSYRGWDVAFGVETQQTGGDPDRVLERDAVYFLPGGSAALSNAPGTMDTSKEVLNAHLNLAKNEWTLHLFANMIEDNAGPGGGQAITYGNDIDTETLLADLTYDKKEFLKNTELLVKLYYAYKHYDGWLKFYPSAYNNWIGEPIGTMQDGSLEVATLYDGFSNHRLRTAVGYKSYEFQPDQYKNFGAPAGPFVNWGGPMIHVTDDNDIYIDENNRWLWYAMLQDEWAFAKHWRLTAGLRFDEYNDFGSSVNPRAALVWESRYDLTTKLLYGTAFRVPSFSEQGLKNNTVGIGNRNIKPEEISYYELAFNYQPTQTLRTMLSLFSYKADELVELVGSNPGIYNNVGKQKGRGFELEMNWQASETLRVAANIAYQRSENKNTGAVIHDAPAKQVFVSPEWNFLPDWTLNVQYFWIGDRHRENGDVREEVSDYDLVNVTIRRRNIAKHLEVAFSAKNLFNEDVREPHAYTAGLPSGSYIPNDIPMESRAIWGELRYTF